MAAAALAVAAHDGQRRKAERDPAPYAVHVFAVAELVAEHTDLGTDGAIAAVLHDTVEDSDVTLAEVEARFGTAVAALVAALTDDGAVARLPLAQRKAAQAAKIAAAPPAARAIKIADQTSNMRDLPLSGRLWPVARCLTYIAGARRVVDACRGPFPALEDAFDAAAAAAQSWAEAREREESAL
ncbi:MAG: HD domain-containing protein [Pseudomonadota bacterium]